MYQIKQINCAMGVNFTDEIKNPEIDRPKVDLLIAAKAARTFRSKMTAHL